MEGRGSIETLWWGGKCVKVHIFAGVVDLSGYGFAARFACSFKSKTILES
jgi:hypothetical protein